MHEENGTVWCSPPRDPAEQACGRQSSARSFSMPGRGVLLLGGRQRESAGSQVVQACRAFQGMAVSPAEQGEMVASICPRGR